MRVFLPVSGMPAGGHACARMCMHVNVQAYVCECIKVDVPVQCGVCMVYVSIIMHACMCVCVCVCVQWLNG